MARRAQLLRQRSKIVAKKILDGRAIPRKKLCSRCHKALTTSKRDGVRGLLPARDSCRESAEAGVKCPPQIVPAAESCWNRAWAPRAAVSRSGASTLRLGTGWIANLAKPCDARGRSGCATLTAP